MPKFSVILTYDVTVSKVCDIEANNREHALSLAREKAYALEDNYEICFPSQPDGFDIEEQE